MRNGKKKYDSSKRVVNKLLVLLFLFLFSGSAKAYFYTYTWVYIESKVNNLNLDVRGGSRSAKAQVWMYTPNGTDAQQWMFVNAGGGYYYIKSKVSGLYLDVQGGSKASKTPVWQYPLNYTDAQKWKPVYAGDGYYYLQSKVSGLYLDVRGGWKDPGTEVWQYLINRTDAQKWKFKKTGPEISARYLGNYPSDRNNGWSNHLQGVGHDASNWFFTQTNWLWKFPVTHDLNRSVNRSNPPAGVNVVGIPSYLKNKGYDHFGDLVAHGGYLFIPLEATGGSNVNNPLLAVFRASNLSFVGTAPMTRQNRAGWVAIHPTTQRLYSSNNRLDGSNRIMEYTIDFGALRRNQVILRFLGTKTLYDSNGAVVSVKQYMQGGEFSSDGKYLYLVNGRASSDTPSRDGGIWVFEFATGRRVLKSSTTGTFKYEYHPGLPSLEEPEGMTYWDLDQHNAPNIKGKLHVILLNTDVTSSDEFWLKHYSVSY